jgi:hypothetical protein
MRWTAKDIVEPEWEMDTGLFRYDGTASCLRGISIAPSPLRRSAKLSSGTLREG